MSQIKNLFSDLPLEIILHIASFIERDYICQDLIDEIEDDISNDGLLYNKKYVELENFKKLMEENKGDGYYYPLRNLYATCSPFNWLSKLEYICIEESEFYYDTVSRNINGLRHGMSFNGTINTGILGYSIYDNGKMIKENILYTDTHNHYRKIDGIVYVDHKNCRRWWSNCNNDCKNCQQLNAIQKDIFTKDIGIEKIFNSEYDNGDVIIRTPLNLELSFDLNYNIEGLVLSL